MISIVAVLLSGKGPGGIRLTVGPCAVARSENSRVKVKVSKEELWRFISEWIAVEAR